MNTSASIHEPWHRGGCLQAARAASTNSRAGDAPRLARSGRMCSARSGVTTTVQPVSPPPNPPKPQAADKTAKAVDKAADKASETISVFQKKVRSWIYRSERRPPALSPPL